MKTNSTPTRSRMDRGDFCSGLRIWSSTSSIHSSVALSSIWLESLGFAAIFVALYVALFRLRRFELRVACVVGMYLLGALTYPINSGAITFFIYVAALLPFVISLGKNGSNLLRRRGAAGSWRRGGGCYRVPNT